VSPANAAPPPEAHRQPPPRQHCWWIVAGLLALAALLLFESPGLLDLADRAGYAVCHRIPERSFVIAGRQAPLCARCSGAYLAALAGMIALGLRGRGRAAALPTPRFWPVLGLFMLAWAVDGTNSFLSLIPGAPLLYEPHNLLRLVTGALEGLVLAACVAPVLNLSLWANPELRPSVASWRDLASLVAAAAVVVALVASAWPPLLYPLALLSAAMVVFLVAIVNSMVVLIVLRRDGRARHWREVALPLLLGLALALIELAAIGLARAFVVERWGLPLG
jgi:uncharacterized membrane protein